MVCLNYLYSHGQSNESSGVLIDTSAKGFINIGNTNNELAMTNWQSYHVPHNISTIPQCNLQKAALGVPKLFLGNGGLSKCGD